MSPEQPQGGGHGGDGHGGDGGGHGVLMMIACCVPMVLIFVLIALKVI